MKIKISLVILTLNEITGLKRLFHLIPKHDIDEVFAIDGGSTDGTVEFLKRENIPVYPQSVLGRGEAFHEAFRRSTGDAIIFFSPDGNENPEDIPKFIPFLRDEYGIVIATRMVKGAHNEEDEKIFRWRKWANLAFTLIVNVLWNRGLFITDTINGFRAITRKTWDEIKLDGPGYTVEFQGSIRAFKRKIKMIEFSTYEGHRFDGRVGSPAISTGVSFLMILLKEIIASIKRVEYCKAGKS